MITPRNIKTQEQLVEYMSNAMTNEIIRQIKKVRLIKKEKTGKVNFDGLFDKLLGHNQ